MQKETDRKLPCQILDTFGQVHYKTREQHSPARSVRNLYMPTGLQSSRWSFSELCDKQEIKRSMVASMMEIEVNSMIRVLEWRAFEKTKFWNRKIYNKETMNFARWRHSKNMYTSFTFPYNLLTWLEFDN